MHTLKHRIMKAIRSEFEQEPERAGHAAHAVLQELRDVRVTDARRAAKASKYLDADSADKVITAYLSDDLSEAPKEAGNVR